MGGLYSMRLGGHWWVEEEEEENCWPEKKKKEKKKKKKTDKLQEWENDGIWSHCLIALSGIWNERIVEWSGKERKKSHFCPGGESDLCKNFMHVQERRIHRRFRDSWRCLRGREREWTKRREGKGNLPFEQRERRKKKEEEKIRWQNRKKDWNKIN